MAQTETSDNYEKLFQELQTFNNKSRVMMHVPSAGESIAFKPLSVKQQTKIITGVLGADQTNNIYAYQNIIDELLQQNCDTSRVDELMIFDRACLLVQLRMHTTGDTITVDDNTYNLKEHVSTFAEISADETVFEKQITYQGIDVTCQAPTLRVDHKINTTVPKLFKNTIDNQAVGDIFLIELAKFITHVNFSGNHIDFSDLTLKQRVKICEILPMVLSQKIVEYIEHVREFEQPFITLPGGVEIPIDSQLFNR